MTLMVPTDRRMIGLDYYFKWTVFLNTPVDWSGRRRRLLREYGAGETPQALNTEEAPRHARGKRSRLERKSTANSDKQT
ncbi:hypothetical protein [Neobacillus cucumis]|uniref:hypothetical protein n=1 Tax=Neobacillus cucumis TaxID=1740721 RepID=UPI0015E10F14|nr:hypothetical protein [Neobacillus cucumis]